MWVLLPFALAGCCAIGLSLWCVLRARSAKSWPIAPGVITTVMPSDDNEVQGKVLYSYSVGGSQYVSDRVMFGDAYGYHLSDHNARSDKFLVGQPVLVRYDAVKPSEAVLELGVASGAVVGLVLGPLFVVVGTAPLWWRFVEPLIP